MLSTVSGMGKGASGPKRASGREARARLGVLMARDGHLRVTVQATDSRGARRQWDTTLAEFWMDNPMCEQDAWAQLAALRRFGAYRAAVTPGAPSWTLHASDVPDIKLALALAPNPASRPYAASLDGVANLGPVIVDAATPAEARAIVQAWERWPERRAPLTGIAISVWRPAALLTLDDLTPSENFLLRLLVQTPPGSCCFQRTVQDGKIEGDLQRLVESGQVYTILSGPDAGYWLGAAAGDLVRALRQEIVRDGQRPGQGETLRESLFR